MVCVAQDQCHEVGICDPGTGACSDPIRTGSCDDGNGCTTGDTCDAGVCAGVLDCNDGNSCTADSCDTTLNSCVHDAQLCASRYGHIDAQTFDDRHGFTPVPEGVKASIAGAWIAFDNVEFGAPGSLGELSVLVLNAAPERHIELRLDSSSGTLVADLLTLPSSNDVAAAQPQVAPFTTTGLQVSGAHRVVLVARSSDVGTIQWFALERGHPSQPITPFPENFRHINPPEQTLLLTNAFDQDKREKDVPDVKWAQTSEPIEILAGKSVFIAFQTTDTRSIVGQVRWQPGPVEVDLSILDNDGHVVATAHGSSANGDGSVDTITAPLPPQQVAVLVKNTGAEAIRVDVLAGTMGEGGEED